MSSNVPVGRAERSARSKVATPPRMLFMLSDDRFESATTTVGVTGVGQAKVGVPGVW